MRYFLTIFIATVCVLITSTFCSQALAEIMTKTIEYKDGDTTLEGFVAWDSEKANAPGVLVVHQWMGLTDYEKRRCKQLAELGYVACALDIYGKGIRPTSMQEAGKRSGSFKNDRALYRKRLNLGLEQLRALPTVDQSKIAAIGYCFGGTGVIELARSGADVNGVVSFHGGLDSPTPADGKNIKARLLICHGADDPYVPVEDIDAMKDELNAAGVDWQMIYYSDTVHSFTQPLAGDDKSKGAAYNAKADARSWVAMNAFFDEIFGQ